MCRFSELTGCKFRREVTLDETYDCQLLLSKITRTGIEFDLLTAMELAVCRSTVPLVVDLAIVAVVTVSCSFLSGCCFCSAFFVLLRAYLFCANRLVMLSITVSASLCFETIVHIMASFEANKTSIIPLKNVSSFFHLLNLHTGG